MRPIQASQKRTDTVILRGGMDLSTPPQQIDPGKITSGSNYEVGPGGGYRRIDGIERFDGRPSPAGATYDIIWGPFSGGSVGDQITGQTSGATATIIALYPPVGQTQAFIVSKRTNTFQNGENILIGTNNVGQVNPIPPTYQQDPWVDMDWRYLAAELYRADIQKPPGSGPIRGVFSIAGSVFCVRNNAGGTQGVMYRATSAGWSAVSLGFSLRYTAGNTGVPIAAGNVVVGATSGATGTVTKVTVESGSDGFQAGNPASGQLIFASITGTFVAGEALNVSGVRRADAVGAQVANTLPVDGRYETIAHNFYGDPSKRAVYVANGVGKAFEFDGTVFCFIESTLSAPRHVEVHGSQLLLAQGATVVMSRPGVPTSFDGNMGAAVIAVGGVVSGMLRVPGATDAVATMIATEDNGVFVLYGATSADMQLVPVAPERSIAKYSLAAIGTPIGLDKNGLTQVLQTSAFGNFAFSSISNEYNRLVVPLYDAVTASVVVPSKNQYRLFFSNGGGIAVTMVGTKPIGAVPFDYNGRTAFCAHLSDIDTEMVFIGGVDGYVYRLDVGTSIDGGPIVSWIRTAPNFSGSYSSRKRYFGVSFEVTPTSAFKATVTPVFSLERGDDSGHAPMELESLGQGARWDEMFWDQFYWDSGGGHVYRLDFNGSGTCVTFLITSESAKMGGWNIESYSISYRQRREER